MEGECELSMDWDFIKEWILSLGVFSFGTASLTAVIGFFGKSLFNTYLTKQIETYKAELQRLTNQHQITFSKLHEERAVVIKELYSKITNLDIKMSNLGKKYETSNELSMEKKWEQAVNSYYAFAEYYNVNRIYFNVGICKTIDGIISNCNKIFVNIDTYGMNKVDSSSDFDVKQIEVLYKNWEGIEGIGSLKTELEKEFRNILGVQEVENTK
jgi:hypothetical protein